MGEYAIHNGEEIKIGTCEDMYYLRADQRFLVDAISNSVNPADPDTVEHLRFRFPFPDEDHILPGQFEKHDRSIAIHGVEVPEDVEHRSVQFIAEGYNVCLPCPESGDMGGLKIHRNGFSGAVHIVQQRIIGNQTVLICRCGGCGALYRLPTFDDVKPILKACHREEERAEQSENLDVAIRWCEIARRITAGYVNK